MDSALHHDPRSPSLFWRGVLAIVLMVGFYILALGMAFALFYVTYAMFRYGERISLQLVVICVFSGGVILWSILPRFDRFPAPGPRLTPDKHPKLFAMIHEAAAQTGQPLPEEVYLCHDLNAWVSQRGGVMGIGGRRVMGIGLPLLQVLSTSQLYAVILHEFGHFHGGDTQIGPWIWKTRSAIIRTVQGLGDSLLQKPFVWYAKAFLRITQAISRRQETAADHLAAHFAGPDAMIQALKVIHGAGLAYDGYWRHEVVPVLDNGYHPPIADGFADYLKAPQIAITVAKHLDEELSGGKSDPYDSHPCLRDRLAELANLPKLPDPLGSAPASSLLGEPMANFESSLLAFLASEAAVAKLKPICWDEVGTGIWLPLWRQQLEPCQETLAPLTAAGVVDLGKTPEEFAQKLAADFLAKGMPAQEAAEVAARRLGAALSVTLAQAGWRVQALPGIDVEMVNIAARPPLPDAMVEELVAVVMPSDEIKIAPFSLSRKLVMGELPAEEWRSQCQQLGIASLGLALPSATTVAASVPATAAVPGTAPVAPATPVPAFSPEKPKDESKPVTSAPSLGSINGVGCILYGNRDAKGDSYITTRWFCVIFIPILAIDAWRVVPAASGGWYFLTKERLSRFARNMNLTMAAMALFIMASLWWEGYTSSPEYVARQNLRAADHLVAAGKFVEAARRYGEVSRTGYFAEAAQAGIHQALEQAFRNEAPDRLLQAYKTLLSMPAYFQQGDKRFSQPFQLGMGYVAKFQDRDPETALQFLDLAGRVKPAGADLLPARLVLLQALLKANPDNVERAVELALIYEKGNALDTAVQVLLPRQAKLGATEGARILGQRFLKDGQTKEAYPLLLAYVQAKLENLRGLERSYQARLQAIDAEALRELNSGHASFNYAGYENSAKPKQQEMVDDYIMGKIKTDAALGQTLEKLKSAGDIVNITLDLGILQLGRAQEMTDPARRKQELESAEKTFLAIRSFAGESDEYQMFLGQVYCWLGRSAEARPLFDKLLAKHQRSYAILLSLAQVYRDLGDNMMARSLVEEAFANTKNVREKQAAASFRASIQKDVDDQIAWLEKCDPASLPVQVELNAAKGERALELGDTATAVSLLQKAVDGYDKQPKTLASLNNGALVCFALFRASGKLEFQQRGLARMREAVAMSPDNSVLLTNSLQELLPQAVRETLGEAILPEAVVNGCGLGMLGLLYDNEAGRQSVFRRFHDSEPMKMAQGFLERALLLAPKDAGLYSIAIRLNVGNLDAAALRKLAERLQTADLNMAEIRTETLATYQKTTAASRQFLAAEEKRLAALLTRPEIVKHPLTHQYLLDEWVDCKLQAAANGDPVEIGKVLAAAEIAYREHRCHTSRSTLIDALMLATQDRLARQDQEFAALATPVRCSLGARQLLTALLLRRDRLTAAIRADGDFQKAMALVQETRANFPDWPTTEEWILLDSADPAASAKTVATFKAHPMASLVVDLAYRINPVKASSVLEFYFKSRMLGDDAKGIAGYDEAVKAGVPLPPR